MVDESMRPPKNPNTRKYLRHFTLVIWNFKERRVNSLGIGCMGDLLVMFVEPVDLILMLPYQSYVTIHDGSFCCHGSSKSRFLFVFRDDSKPNERPPNFQTKVKTWALDWYSLKASCQKSRRCPETKPLSVSVKSKERCSNSPSPDVPNKIILKKNIHKTPYTLGMLFLRNNMTALKKKTTLVG